MCCQIVARKSSGDFRRRLAPRYICEQDQDFRECVMSMIFQEILVFFAWRAWRGGFQLKISLRFFFVFNFFLNIMMTCDQQKIFFV